MARGKREKSENEMFYHVISRIANQAYLMTDKVKSRMLEILHASASFSGVTVCTYMLMDNHFHLIVHVPAAESEPVPEDVVLERVSALYGAKETQRLKKRWAQMRNSGMDSIVEAELNRLRHRMRDISEFIKTFKQRVTQWYNTTHGHVGTLWSGRFKSPRIESGEHLATCMAYIHNNPVSAGIVEKALDYPWGAQWAASHGDERARKGLAFLSEEYRRYAAEGRFSWKNVPVISGRDRRLSNGVVIGSLEFVNANAPRPAGGRYRRWRAVHLCGNTYCSHGQRSAPKNAKAA